MLIIWLLSLFLLAAPAAAFADSAKSLTVTVYNGGRALVNEVRSMDLPEGQARVEFQDVAQTIEAPSLQVKSLTAPDAFKVMDMNYEYDLVNTQNLLNRYVGKELRVKLTGYKCQDCMVVKDATLLANTDRPIFEVDGEIYVGNYESVLLPELPEGLRPRPTLVWLVDNQGPATQDIEASYLAGGLDWRADYVLKVDKDEKGGALSGWVTLSNTSGKSYEDASLKLVAGDVNRARPEMNMYKQRAMAAAPMMESADVAEEEFFEYHLYNVTRPVTVLQNQTKQISLLQAPSMTVAKKLVGRYGGYSGTRGAKIKQPVKAYLTFTNDKKNGLGLPLPKGIVRAYQQSNDGSTLFVGEDRIDHTAKHEEVKLLMGESFDVKVDRVQTAYEKLGSKTVRYGWEISVLNAKNEPQTVHLEESIPGDWKITEASMDYTKLDAHTIEFVVTAPPAGEEGKRTTLSYTAVVDY